MGFLPEIRFCKISVWECPGSIISDWRYSWEWDWGHKLNNTVECAVRPGCDQARINYLGCKYFVEGLTRTVVGRVEHVLPQRTPSPPFSSRSTWTIPERVRCLAHKCFSVYCVRSERHLCPSVCKMAARSPLSRGVPFFNSKEKIVPLFVQGMHFLVYEHACWIRPEFWNRILGWITLEFDGRIPSCMVDLRLASRSQCESWVLCYA